MSANKKASPSTDEACSAMNNLDLKDEEEAAVEKLQAEYAQKKAGIAAPPVD